MNNFGELNWQELGRQVPTQIRRVLLPVGTIEAHGVTPLATDNIIPEYLCDQLADDLEALVAPTINYGITRSLAGFPGSFGVQPETLRRYMLDVMLGLHGCGFERIAVMNGHGGNNATLKQVAYEFFERTGAQVCVVHWWDFCNEVCRDVFGQAGGHAGCDETAMLMAARPDLVRPELFTDDLGFDYHPAVDIYPAPSSIMRYTAGEGNPDFDAERCSEYAKRSVALVREFLLGLWQAWDRMLDPART